jgi:NADH dehydrogenase
MKNVVVVGAGYGGLRAVEHLSKAKKFAITLIDQHAYHYMQTETYGYIAGRFDIADIALDLRTFTQGLKSQVNFIQDTAIDIDKQNQQLICENHQVLYDYIIIAVGAETHFFSFIPGAREYTHGVKSIERAFAFRQAFEKQLYTKLQHKEYEPKEHLHVAIAGAGLSGVEIAAEMAYALKHYRKIFAQNSIDITISLVDVAETILPGMDGYIIEQTQKRLEELGVRIFVKSRISEICQTYIRCEHGTQLPYDFVIFTAGIKGVAFTKSLKNKQNWMAQLIPNEYLQLDYENVYAIGDCAQIKDQYNAIMPPTAQIAEKSAQYVVQNIMKQEKNQTLSKFNTKIDGVFVALGGHYAVGTLFGKLKLKGFLAYLVKKFITRSYRLGLEFKVNSGYKKRVL